MFSLWTTLFFALICRCEGLVSFSHLPSTRARHTWTNNAGRYATPSDNEEINTFNELLLSYRDNGKTMKEQPTNTLEISRRVALVMAAIMTVGTTTTTKQAVAATIQRQVLDIKRTNLATVNTNGAPEKHIPIITIDDKSITAKIPHVMDSTKPHWIEYVWIQDVNRKTILAVQQFQPTDPSPPTVTCTNVVGTTKKTLIRAYGYCNLHGLWESDIVSV